MSHVVIRIQGVFVDKDDFIVMESTQASLAQLRKESSEWKVGYAGLETNFADLGLIRGSAEFQ